MPHEMIARISGCRKAKDCEDSDFEHDCHHTATGVPSKEAREYLRKLSKM